jgi:hypothetical protein
MAMFSNIFKKKWIEDSIEPYSLQTMADYTKNLDRVFPVYNVDLVTARTKESEKYAALLSVYVKTKIFANMSAMLMRCTVQQWTASFRNPKNWNSTSERNQKEPTNYR